MARACGSWPGLRPPRLRRSARGSMPMPRQTGQSASLTLVNDESDYLHDLPQALASDSPPDVCLVDARDFSGADPARDFASVTPDRASAARSIAAFALDGAVKALPDEFSVDFLYYSPLDFDRAGIAAPGPHWNWDVLEAISRAITSLNLTNAKGAPVYALELPDDFDFWNMLCTAGRPARARRGHVAPGRYGQQERGAAQPRFHPHFFPGAERHGAAAAPGRGAGPLFRRPAGGHAHRAFGPDREPAQFRLPGDQCAARHVLGQSCACEWLGGRRRLVARGPMRRSSPPFFPPSPCMRAGARCAPPIQWMDSPRSARRR